MNAPSFRSASARTVTADVLVVGGGAAGIRAACSAAESGASVLLVSDDPPTRGGSSFRNLSGGWGIQALVEEERSDAGLESFYRDVLRVGLGQANPGLVRILVEESGPRITDLMEWGVRFRRGEQGTFVRVAGCFSKARRAFLTDSMENVQGAFLSAVRRSSVKTLTGSALQLLEADGACWGAWVVDPSGELLRVTAPATILAAGGGAGLFLRALVSRTQVGAGCALALEAGATLRNMAFVQLMLTLEREGELRFLPLQELRGEGCLRTVEGKDLLEARIPDPANQASAVERRRAHYPFSTRDASLLVDLAVAEENSLHREVLWEAAGNEPAPWTVSHAAHAFNGGIRIDERAESDIPGLFAAGETAAGPHGADRIGGCMMTATQVFGARAGRFAAEHARKNPRPPEHFPEPGQLAQQARGPSSLDQILEIESLARACFQTHLGVARHGRGLRECLTQVRALRQEAGRLTWRTLRDFLSLRRLLCSLTMGEAVARDALDRPRSIGGHMRTDTAGRSQA